MANYSDYELDAAMQGQPSREKAEPPSVSIQQENHTNLVLSRAAGGQRSNLDDPQAHQEQVKVIASDLDDKIAALQKQLSIAETFEERRALRGEIRELRQKKNGLNDDAKATGPDVEQDGQILENGKEHQMGSEVNVGGGSDDGVVNPAKNSSPAVGEDYMLADNEKQAVDGEVDSGLSPPLPANDGLDCENTQLLENGVVAKEGSNNVGSFETDIMVDLPDLSDSSAKELAGSVDVSDQSAPADSAGCGCSLPENEISNADKLSTGNSDATQTPLLENGEKNVLGNDEKLPPPVAKKSLPAVPLKPKARSATQPKGETCADNQQKEEKTETATNMLPSNIKKKQKGGGLRSIRPDLAGRIGAADATTPKIPPAAAPANPVLEVVKRPEGSRRARIIRSYLELERIKKEGVKTGADGKPVQITAPNLGMLEKLKGAGTKGISGAGGGLRGSDNMLEEMINMQLLQAMGVNPLAVATTAPSSTPAADPSVKPERPSHLAIPAPIKQTKPGKVGSGPSQGIAKIMTKFGDSASSGPKQGLSTYHSNGNKASTFPKGLKKPGGKMTYSAEVKENDIAISLKEDNRRLFMNKLGHQPGLKGK
ncbi:uncharacterized protein [Diadema antillarum]|uniref:uncharacterized protein n=1 Tax=Diadema antillarum TaxID=105358 RepID=UPI003A84AEEA